MQNGYPTMKIRTAAMQSASISGVAPMSGTMAGVFTKNTADTAQASRNVNQNPWPNARRAPASSPAPSKLPHTAETPWPRELPSAMLTISNVMTTLMQAKPTGPIPLPTTTPSETTMAIWASTPTSEMAA